MRILILFTFSCFCSMYMLNGQNAKQIEQIRKSINISDWEDANDEISALEHAREQRILDAGWDLGTRKEGDKYLLDIVNGEPLYVENYNRNSRISINVDEINSGGSAGLSLDGQGMTVGVWEVNGSALTTHVAFNNRVSIIDNNMSNNRHATHVTATIAGDGTGATADSGTGMAPAANILAADTANDTAEMNIQALVNGLLVSNHSYGLSLDTASPLWIWGAYGSNARAVDLLTFSNPFYLPVYAAGNSRDDGVNPTKNGYDLINGAQASKNSMVVAAVSRVIIYIVPSNVGMSGFSNWGPTDDGRIKPDISAMGVNVLSATNSGNTDYTTLSGTSMASPAIAGMGLLLQQHYSNLNSGSFMRSATLKGLITHTAKEAGRNPGPDYEFGWGLADARAAVDLVTNNGSTTYMEEVDYAGSPRTFQIRADGTGPLKVTIVWTDRAGNTSTIQDERTPDLVNDLDIKLTRNGVTHWPWTLDFNNPANGALRTQRNDVDNIEQVQVDAPSAGDVFDVEISNDGPITGTQNYSLLVTGGVPVTLSTLENQFGADKDLTVYPNPASQFITLKSLESLKNIQIVNTVGAIVTKLQTMEEGQLIDVSNLPSGVYFVQGQNLKGNLVQTRFVKK